MKMFESSLDVDRVYRGKDAHWTSCVDSLIVSCVSLNISVLVSSRPKED